MEEEFMILIIDDEQRYIQNYQEELEDIGFKTLLLGDVDEAYEALELRKGELEGIVLDIMMPYGTHFTADETLEGVKTGIKFYERIEPLVKDVPVFVLTNVSNPEVSDYFGDKLNCHFFRKDLFTPGLFGEQVEAILRKN